MTKLLLFLYAFYVFFQVILNILEIKNINKTKKQKAVILSEQNYQKAANYKLINQKISLFNSIYDLFCVFIWILFGFSFLQNILADQTNLVKNVLFVDIFLIVNYFLSLPFDLYNTFYKDKKYGFSTIDFKTYLIDQIKGGVLFLLFGSAVFALISLIISNFTFWWFYAFLAIFTILIVINLIYPTFIAPIFNKFKPLENEDLRSSIDNLLTKSGLKSDGVFVIDASKRDKRLNAFFAGLGSSKRVVLYDTLLEKLNKCELLAVLGHELGHFKHKDIIKRITLMGVVLFGTFAFFGNLPSEIYALFGGESYAVIVFFIIFSNPFFFVLMPIFGYFSRKDEYSADNYASICESKEALISALKKLADENSSYPHSHPLNVIFYHSHPPLIKRLEALGAKFDD